MTPAERRELKEDLNELMLAHLTPLNTELVNVRKDVGHLKLNGCVRGEQHTADIIRLQAAPMKLVLTMVALLTICGTLVAVAFWWHDSVHARRLAGQAVTTTH